MLILSFLQYTCFFPKHSGILSRELSRELFEFSRETRQTFFNLSPNDFVPVRDSKSLINLEASSVLSAKYSSSGPQSQNSM